MKIVEIEWLDSKGSYVVWQFKDEYHDDLGYCKTVGYLVKKNKEVTIVCQSETEDQYGKVFRIPTRAITKLSYLEKRN